MNNDLKLEIISYFFKGKNFNYNEIIYENNDLYWINKRRFIILISFKLFNNLEIKNIFKIEINSTLMILIEIKKMIASINLGKMKAKLEKSPNGIKTKYRAIISKGY